MSAPNSISEKTKVPILWLFTTASACCAAALFFYDIKTDLKEIRRDMMSRHEMREFADELRSENKGLIVPHVKLAGGIKVSGKEVANVKME